MGWCHEFGVTVREGCGHPMTAAESSCQCDVCGLVCKGEFAGCSRVWAKGPREVILVRTGESALGGRDPFLPPLDVIGEGVDEATATVRLQGNANVKANVNPRVNAVPSEQTRHSEPQAPQGAKPPPPPPPPPPPLPTGAPLPVATADEARGQVFEWLYDSFDSLRSQLRVLSDAVSRQERTLDTMSEAGVAAERLAALADVLHDRIGDAVHGAITSQEAEPNGGAKRVDSLGGDPATTHAYQPSAATVRPAINSSGWQDRLLALRPAESQSGG